MTSQCEHIPADPTAPTPSGNGCADCIAEGRGDWVHLRLCQECGHVGCCDNSPGLHATGHFNGTNHPLIRSFEPGEDWWWCYVDEAMFRVREAEPGPSHT